MAQARLCSAESWQSRLVEYATVFSDLALTPELLEALAALVEEDFHGIPVIFEYDPSGKLLAQNTLTTMDEAAMREYHAYFHSVNPLPGEVVRRKILDRAVVLSEEVGRAALERTEYYNDFLRPHRLEHVVGFSAVAEGFGRASFNLVRGRRAGDFTPLEAERLYALRPFFRGATLLRRMHQELLHGRTAAPGPGASDPEASGVAPFPIRGAIRLALEPFLRERFSLSPRQAAVAAMLVDGKTYKEIAAALGISFETVSTHVKTILDRTGAESSRRLAAVVRERWNA